jgi:hypothetical protein
LLSENSEDFPSQSDPKSVGGLMKLLNILVLFAFSFFWTQSLNAEIYIWTDENGIKHFSDQPPADKKGVQVQVESHAYQYDEAADGQRTETEQKQLQDFIEEVDENYEKDQQEMRRKAEEAERDRPPSQEEKIAAEQQMLEQKISDLEAQPLEYFGSQKNKRVRIGYYRYRLEALLEDPDAYFKNPEPLEGNIKEP